jgi:hypothetical protein
MSKEKKASSVKLKTKKGLSERAMRVIVWLLVFLNIGLLSTRFIDLRNERERAKVRSEKKIEINDFIVVASAYSTETNDDVALQIRFGHNSDRVGSVVETITRGELEHRVKWMGTSAEDGFRLGNAVIDLGIYGGKYRFSFVEMERKTWLRGEIKVLYIASMTSADVGK